MTIAALGNILKVFGGHEVTAEERRQLVKEALVMTLARAASADTNIAAIEVSTVKEILKTAIGDDVSDADIRVAAHSELFETMSLESALGKLSKKLESEDRMLISRSLVQVMTSDRHVSASEQEFFDRVAKAIKIKPWELAGLSSESA